MYGATSICDSCEGVIVLVALQVTTAKPALSRSPEAGLQGGEQSEESGEGPQQQAGDNDGDKLAPDNMNDAGTDDYEPEPWDHMDGFDSIKSWDEAYTLDETEHIIHNSQEGVLRRRIVDDWLAAEDLVFLSTSSFGSSFRVERRLHSRGEVRDNGLFAVLADKGRIAWYNRAISQGPAKEVPSLSDVVPRTVDPSAPGGALYIPTIFIFLPANEGQEWQDASWDSQDALKVAVSRKLYESVPN
ncbi:hypothetical protein DFS34DRAFT_691881 [Phlyctochytrium arcticum]|nr:hypothetical protein DFS34DRAFT_678101 [Phlyctochytrium arcticum]KAI9103375.1 hypothetical protein DFS34DRAFT_691881 [Phlyctochytrium arcticum]